MSIPKRGDEGSGVESDKEGSTSEENIDENEPATGVHYEIFVHTRRCEEVCYGLGITLKHIRKMKKKYDDNDMYCTGEITQAEFFYMINEEERPISKGIFKFGGIERNQKYISFDEYLLCVVQFASLTKPELFQYVFDLYDEDQSGTLDEHEFTHMNKELQSKQFCYPKNVETAIRMLGGADGGCHCTATEDGLVDLAQFMRFAKNFPVAFYPIVNMQKNVRAATMGESFWSQVVARRLKIQDLVTYMRRNYGAAPEMTLRERVSSIFFDDVFDIRKRAGELYALKLKQRKKLGWAE
uniref:EF-hand domain-containing protein n=1 Tax=Globisporangium ultimum (strain ATCC 200006 / CBS 805.95 / DAOM BR144) TaxID=431595 RepID=K3WID8_GLOUD